MQKKPTISYIIASRDDEYAGRKSILRLTQVLDNLEQTPESHSFETILVDWGSTGLADWFKDTDGIEAFRPMKVLEVPTSITSLFSSSFPEVLALNLAARFASGQWIGRLDQDTIVGLYAANWLSMPHVEHTAYFSTRRELPKGQTDFDYRSLRPNLYPTWRSWNVAYEQFYKAAVGLLLVPRSTWIDLRGYDEKNLGRNHMEHEFCIRLRRYCGLYNLSVITNADFYHQWHPSVERPSNPLVNEAVLEQEALMSVVRNDENWGLGSFLDQIKVVEL